MKKVELSVRSERFIGFTVPQDGRFLICDHDQVWEVNIAHGAAAQPTNQVPQIVAARPDFVGWGRQDATPVTKAGAAVISYDFNPTADFVRVQYTVSQNAGAIEFPTLSGDWFAASLSVEGDLLILAEPYRLDLYKVA